MNEKMKSCFTSHIIIHSIFGLGLGILLVALMPAISSIWLGLIIMIIAFIADYMRKAPAAQ